MVAADDDSRSALESRPPTLDDLLALCGNLNAQGARYIVIGGMAMLQHGFVRATEDIDLLVDPSPENQALLRRALERLPDQAVREVSATDLDTYSVVRVADEIVVDLMKEARGVRYEAAEKSIQRGHVRDVMIPFASPELLWRLKQGVREKDALDREFLKRLLGK